MKKLMFLVFSCIFVLSTNIVGAEEDETTTLNNEAQVQKAENLADASLAAAQKDAELDVSTAQDTYDANPTPENLDALNTAIADLSTVSGVSQTDIEGMRADGMGWGDIAHELGVHPSVLGVRNTKQNEAKERNRNTKSFSTQAESSSSKGASALGLAGKSKSNSGKSNNAGGNSKGGNNGNNGNNGNGNGNGGKK